MQHLPRALVVEDHTELCEIYRRLLEKHFEVDVAPTISEMRRMICESRNSYDLFLVDLLLSDGNVLNVPADDQLFVKLRTTPTIVISETDDLGAMTHAAGWARDYLTKPFNNNELVHRCLRFACCHTPDLSLRDLSLRYGNRETEPLTMTEFKLAQLLMRADKNGVAKSDIAKAIYQNPERLNQVEVSLSRLRRKLAAIGFTVATTAEHSHHVRLMPLPGETRRNKTSTRNDMQ